VISAAPTAQVYHPAIDRILTGLLGSAEAVARVRRTATDGTADPLTGLLHDAALRARERDLQLARMIRHAISDLQAAQAELAEGRSAEHLLIGRHDQLVVLADRHHDALAHLEALARAAATTPHGDAAS
jgi:hypothetical protein